MPFPQLMPSINSLQFGRRLLLGELIENHNLLLPPRNTRNVPTNHMNNVIANCFWKPWASQRPANLSYHFNGWWSQFTAQQWFSLLPAIRWIHLMVGVYTVYCAIQLQSSLWETEVERTLFVSKCSYTINSLIRYKRMSFSIIQKSQFVCHFSFALVMQIER